MFLTFSDYIYAEKNKCSVMYYEEWLIEIQIYHDTFPED